MPAIFEVEYQKLNKAQREAVDTIAGPVMVVAGPGTGKTQILALRIANILNKTDIKADGILCLTFTNAGVEAMRKRLLGYIGEAGNEVNIFTFHSFGMQIIESYFQTLGFPEVPSLLDDADTAMLFDEILEGNDWRYLRPRSDASRYFGDLRSLISHLKRENIKGEDFLTEIEKEIKTLASSEENISTRGASKGELKKEVADDIMGLERTREVVTFFDLYEEVKREKNVLDYDDVLTNLVKLTEISDDAVADIREIYLYVLVDEHQDSNRVQNEFLENVWAKVESPDIFVVGDDRQLIYGFSGASIDHFRGFKKVFKDAKLITLVDNYRSTQVILDASHALLQSVMTPEKLVSQNKEHHPIRLVEMAEPTDEIVAAGEDIKAKNLPLENCAILVPKNIQVARAIPILHGLGLAVSSLEALNLFEEEDAQAYIRVLEIISGTSAANSSNSSNSSNPSLALSFFDAVSGLTPLEAHRFIAGQNMREFSLQNITTPNSQTLFGVSKASLWIEKLLKWQKEIKEHALLEILTKIGEELLVVKKDRLVGRREIIHTINNLAEKEVAKNPELTLREFVSFIKKLESYGEHVPVMMEPNKGVKVLTLHSSKGLEFDYVWIAHLDERSLNSGKKSGFVLPKKIAERLEEQDIDKNKRKLYVAITRAKRFCTLSYARYSKKESPQEVARVISDLPSAVLEKEIKDKNGGHEIETAAKTPDLVELAKLVAEKYRERYVSVSLLNNFFECPWKWYFRNILQLPEPEMETLQFGTAVHATIDRILKLTNLPSRGEVEEIIMEEILKLGLPNERARMRMGAEVKSLMLPWVAERLPQIKLSRKTEEGISVKDERFPHLKIFGKIDLIENLSKEEVRVTDFKTGSGKRKSEIEKLDEEGRLSGLLRQLTMYSYLLETNPGWRGIVVRESRLEFLEAQEKNQKNQKNQKINKSAIYDKVITKHEIDMLVQDMRDYDELVKTGGWLDRSCHHNAYGKNTPCPYCKRGEKFMETYLGPLSSQPK